MDITPIQSMEDWRTILFIVLIAIFGMLIVIAVTALKIIRATRTLQESLGARMKTSASKSKPRKVKASNPDEGKRRYQIIFERLMHKGGAENNPKQSQEPKRRYEIILDSVRNRFTKKTKR